MTSAVVKRSRSCVRRCARWNPASAAPPDRKNRCSRRKNASSTCCCRGVSRLAGKQFFLSPLLEEPFPEGAASAEVRTELLPVARHELRRREGPYVGVPRLAQDLAQQPKAVSLGRRPQASLNVAHGKGSVPREVRDDLRIGHVGAKELRAGHGGGSYYNPHLSRRCLQRLASGTLGVTIAARAQGGTVGERRGGRAGKQRPPRSPRRPLLHPCCKTPGPPPPRPH